MRPELIRPGKAGRRTEAEWAVDAMEPRGREWKGLDLAWKEEFGTGKATIGLETR
jgi:hypothetical protein